MFINKPNIKNSLNHKKEIVFNLNKLFNASISLILIDPTNLKSNELNYFRMSFKKDNVYFKIVKNSLLNKSIIKTKFKNIKFNSGPTLILCSNNDIVFLIKKVKNFIKNANNGKIKLVFYKNKTFNDNEINYIYNLPSYNELIKKLIYVINKFSVNRFILLMHLLKKIKDKGA